MAHGTHSLNLDAGVDRFRALCYNSSHHQPPSYWLAGDSYSRSETPGNSLYFFSVPVFLGGTIGSLAANNLFFSFGMSRTATWHLPLSEGRRVSSISRGYNCHDWGEILSWAMRMVERNKFTCSIRFGLWSVGSVFLVSALIPIAPTSVHDTTSSRQRSPSPPLPSTSCRKVPDLPLTINPYVALLP